MFRLAQEEVQNIAKLIEERGFLHKKVGDDKDKPLAARSSGEAAYADLDQMFSFLSEHRQKQETKVPNAVIDEIGQQFDQLIQKTENEMNELMKQLPDEKVGEAESKTSNNDHMMVNGGASADTQSIEANSLISSQSPTRDSIHSSNTATTEEINANNLADNNSRQEQDSPLYMPLQETQRSYSFEFRDNEHKAAQDLINSNGTFNSTTTQTTTNNVPNGNNAVHTNHCMSNKRPLTNGVNDNALEQRRKQRVDRKIMQIQEESQQQCNAINAANNQQVNRNGVAQTEDASVELRSHDMQEFAEKYFNSHVREFGSGMMRTLTRRKRSEDVLSKSEMVTWSANNAIPTSHIHMHDPENTIIACTMFKELCKLLQGEMKPELEVRLIQTIISHCIEREELRDELFVQLTRQSTKNPSRDEIVRCWMMLGLTTASFHPSKVFAKYFYSYLRKHLRKDAAISCYAQFCLDNLHSPKAHVRRMPPSSLEINAVRTLSSLVCRFYFLDGRTKAIDIHPCDTANDAMVCLANKIGLRSLDGWALYELTPEYERVIKGHDYLADIITHWEILQRNSTYGSKYGTVSKHGPNNHQTALGGGECRFVFKKRLFRNTREIPHDPVEVNLLYAQAVHSVARKDDFPVSERIALQLAGLQAQVSLGDYVEGRLESYEDVENYLCFRIRRSSSVGTRDLAIKIAEAHKMYGKGKADLIAKVWYLSVVMQYPLYGTTLFPVTYKGYLSYGHHLLLGINAEGILITNPGDKSILNAYRYCDIESLTVYPTENFVTIKLVKALADTHKCFTFETNQKEEIASLVASYSPSHSHWMRSANGTSVNVNAANEPNKRRLLKMTLEDRMKLHHDVVNCRRMLIESNIMRKPSEEHPGFLRNTLRRLNRSKVDKLRQDYGELEEGFKHFSHSFWAYTKTPMMNSILVISDVELETTAVNNFAAILAYSGLTLPESDESGLDEHEWPRATERDQIRLAQNILDKCLRKDADILRNEFFLQLIKQTTDHPDPNSKVNVRHWQLLALACSVTHPSDRRILAYLHAHLRRCALDEVTEEGQFAHFTLRNLQGTLETRGRKLAPSRPEIMSTINCRRIYARIHFLDGQFQAVEFDACATISEVIEQIQIKIDLRQNAPGYALYQILGINNEQALQPEEKVGDAIAFWEKWHEEQGKMLSKKSQHFFVFKVISDKGELRRKRPFSKEKFTCIIIIHSLN